ncbi:MAG: hypothetical protein HC896_18270 [Bacteroidales bacterium]|nr:hypothetical protein [Bacteroidales bacterium]
MPEGASATKLRYRLGETWFNATFSATPQDTATGGGSTGGAYDYVLNSYLGNNPLFYKIDSLLQAESTLEIELTFVQLLAYKLGQAVLVFPNNYTSIQQEPLDSLSLRCNIYSDRQILWNDLVSHTRTGQMLAISSAQIAYWESNKTADKDFVIQYQLSLEELGLFSLSTFLNDSLVNGWFGPGIFHLYC